MLDVAAPRAAGELRNGFASSSASVRTADGKRLNQFFLISHLGLLQDWQHAPFFFFSSCYFFLLYNDFN